eukprot:14873-Heterococcus_DN1.PRE.2
MCYWCGCFLPDDGQYHAKRNELEVKLTCELLLAICSLEKKRYRCLIVLARSIPETKMRPPTNHHEWAHLERSPMQDQIFG